MMHGLLCRSGAEVYGIEVRPLAKTIEYLPQDLLVRVLACLPPADHVACRYQSTPEPADRVPWRVALCWLAKLRRGPSELYLGSGERSSMST
jgi:hypothetical protein